MHTVPTEVPIFPPDEIPHLEPDVSGLGFEAPLEQTNGLAVPLMEGMVSDAPIISDPINVPNHGAVPGLTDEAIVEVPVTVDRDGIHRRQMEPLPEGILALLRPEVSINQLLVEAHIEESKTKLLQAILISTQLRLRTGAQSTQ